MIEDRLRATFDVHEPLAPDAGVVSERIAEGYRRARRWRRMFRTTGVACVAAILAAAPPVAVHLADGRPAPAPVRLINPPHAVPSGALNFLLLGIDTTTVTGTGQPVRADTIMIAHVPTSHDRAYLISVPRDLLVDVPADPGTRYAGGQAKINAAYAYGSMNGGGTAGGYQLTARALTAVSGLTFDGGAVFSYGGLSTLVDALGGVNLYVDERTTSIHIGWTGSGTMAVPYRTDGVHFTPVAGVRPQVYQVGTQHLAGWQAVDYARQRELLANGDGDVGRQRHIRQLMVAVLSSMGKADVLTDPARLSKLIEAVQRTVMLDTGGVSVGTLAGLVPGPDALVGIGVPTGDRELSGTIVEDLTSSGKDLLAAVRADQVDGWVAAHPGG